VAALSGRKLLLCVCGGIAAYKAAELVRRLRDSGAEVRVAMTADAHHFVGAATFQALSGNPVRDSLWDAAAEAAMGHIELARWPDRIVVAPATANTLARLAHGLADDLVSTLCLATEAPILVAPAMNRVMWAHPATQANVETLRSRRVRILGPASGGQACGETGEGRMVEADDIVAAVTESFSGGRTA
jgi:phosphopantothenoylcysteine decarboxylase/phosphopantothenate--cysteine ligase